MVNIRASTCCCGKAVPSFGVPGQHMLYVIHSFSRSFVHLFIRSFITHVLFP